jgi:hypothetical protein
MSPKAARKGAPPQLPIYWINPNNELVARSVNLKDPHSQLSCPANRGNRGRSGLFRMCERASGRF